MVRYLKNYMVNQPIVGKNAPLNKERVKALRPLAEQLIALDEQIVALLPNEGSPAPSANGSGNGQVPALWLEKDRIVEQIAQKLVKWCPGLQDPEKVASQDVPRLYDGSTIPVFIRVDVLETRMVHQSIRMGFLNQEQFDSLMVTAKHIVEKERLATMEQECGGDPDAPANLSKAAAFLRTCMTRRIGTFFPQILVPEEGTDELIELARKIHAQAEQEESRFLTTA